MVSEIRLTRREMLRLALMGGIGALAAACAPTPPTAPSVQAPPAAPAAPTAAPPPPTAQPAAPAPAPAPATVAGAAPPTALPATVAPAAKSAAVAVPTTKTLAQDIATAATKFLASLEPAKRAKASYAFKDEERTRWHWTTPSGFPRNGLPLKEMSQSQRDLALALLRTSVSEAGFQKSLNIITLQKDLSNDPELYYVTVFGAPGETAPWGWRFEGHHLSRHITVVGDQIAITPLFHGAWPTVNNAGLKAMEREEWAARELITSLEGQKRRTALFQDRTLTQHVTWNEAYVKPLAPVGLAASEFSSDQQALILEVIQNYLGSLPAALAALHLDRLKQAGLETIRFGWAGPLEARKPYYYRLQGPTFLMEHDNSRNGGTHIHSVWRDFKEDFGQGLS